VKVTTGALIYLVSACASGEEFVAAFRRYADKNGLFVPIAAPIPAGRRGRFAVTLKDGGVMIEGEADIVSSATTPSVLHGRVGMTLRFVEPDIKSKTVLVELEQARLAMKPQPPSVPPRPAQVPAEPRPKVPTPAGRIDANNALAECVAIGDIDALDATVPQIAKTGPKFVVPSIPPVAGQRPKSPTTPPLAYPALEKKATPPNAYPALEKKATPPNASPSLAKPATPSRPQTPSTPPPLAPPAIPPAPQITAAPVTPMSITTVDGPIVTPTSMGIAEPAEEVRDTAAMPAIDPVEAVAAMQQHARSASDELTIVPQTREAEVFAVAVPPGSDSDTFPAAQRPRNDSDTFPVTPVPTKPDGVPEPVSASASGSISKPNGNSARIALPPPRRTSNNTQPPVPRNPTPAAPLPVVAKPRNATPAAPLPLVKQPAGSVPIATRSPTRIGLPIVELKTPAPPSGEIPLAPVIAEPKPSPPDITDEPTDLTSVPIVADAREESAATAAPPPPEQELPYVPGGVRKTVIGVAIVPEGLTVLPATPTTPVGKPTEIEAAPEPKVEVNLDEKPAPKQPAPVIEEPSGDWTMIPGETGLTILPRKSEPVVENKPGDDKQLPTGDWTIARVEDSPDGWGAPAKVDLKPVRANIRSNTGPPVSMVAGEKPLEDTSTEKQFDIEEETKSGLKIEIDSSLPVERPTTGVDFSLASTQFAAPVAPPLTPVPGTLAPVVMPLASMAPMARVPSHGSGSFPDFQTASRNSAPADLFQGAAFGNDSTSIIERNRKRRIIIIAASAGAAIVLGVVLLIVFGLSNDTKQPDTSAAVKQPVVTPADAAEAVGSNPTTDMAVKDPVVVDAAVEPAEPADAASAAIAPDPTPPTECIVEVTSSPSGAEILRDKQPIGTTPTKLTMPCGVETKLVLRKARFASSSRTVTPTAKGVKVRVSLSKPMLSVKVTSSPAGATITLGSKSLGVTPAMVKLPANESSTLVISKPGFAADSQKVTPKQNNQAVHATLKKKGR